jgi:hypothetical protein
MNPDASPQALGNTVHHEIRFVCGVNVGTVWESAAPNMPRKMRFMGPKRVLHVD